MLDLKPEYLTLTVAVISAILGGLFSVLCIFLKDFLAQKYFQDTQIKKSQDSVFQTYADPLSRATESLVWRCSELLDERYDSFFSEKPAWPYIEYKRVSTVYRLAALLGWITAYEREISFLRASSNETPLQDPINALRSALADGPHIEEQRLINVLRLVDHEIEEVRSEYPKEFTKVASRLENNLKSELNELKKSNAGELPVESIQKIYNLLKGDASELLRFNFPNSLPESFTARLDLKEAWLYRDWQTAIGETMLQEIAVPATRRFDIRGYSDFETTYSSELSLSLARLKAIFTNLEPTKRDPSDARINQFRATTRAIAELFLTLRENDPKPLMPKAQLKSAELILKLNEESNDIEFNRATRRACKLLLTWKDAEKCVDGKWIAKARELSTITNTVAHAKLTTQRSRLT